MPNKDVFISYKAEEMDQANWVKSNLENNGVSCWMAPECIPGGSSYATEIPQAIRCAKVFVLILSPRAQLSKWVSRETDIAINENKVIMPFMIEQFKLRDEFAFYLTNVQAYYAFEDKTISMNKMIDDIKSIIGSKENNSESNEILPEMIEEKECVVQKIEEATIQSKKSYDVMSILSFVFGLFSIIGYFLINIPCVVAMILSILSLKKIQKQKKQGKTFALLGFIFGAFNMVIGFSFWFDFFGVFLAITVVIVLLVFFIKEYVKLKE